MTTTIDWGRAALVGSVAGGIFWAFAALVIMTSDGSPIAVTAVSVAGAAAIAAGALAYRASRGIRGRTYAVGIILAPLTGATAIGTFVLGALLVQVIL